MILYKEMWTSYFSENKKEDEKMFIEFAERHLSLAKSDIKNKLSQMDNINKNNINLYKN